ncbi:hypothetical protein Aperf_G00000014122 [Anoplocephala perfoliata]
MITTVRTPGNTDERIVEGEPSDLSVRGFLALPNKQESLLGPLLTTAADNLAAMASITALFTSKCCGITTMNQGGQVTLGLHRAIQPTRASFTLRQLDSTTSHMLCWSLPVASLLSAHHLPHLPSPPTHLHSNHPPTIHQNNSTIRRLGYRIHQVIVHGGMTPSPARTAVVTFRPLNVEVTANLQPRSAVDDELSTPSPSPHSFYLLTLQPACSLCYYYYFIISSRGNNKTNAAIMWHSGPQLLRQQCGWRCHCSCIHLREIDPTGHATPLSVISSRSSSSSPTPLLLVGGTSRQSHSYLQTL